MLMEMRGVNNSTTLKKLPTEAISLPFIEFTITQDVLTEKWRRRRYFLRSKIVAI